ncbi:MAG: hypothetical protein PQJ44_06835 [Sphaerochaetaceae bacterium]|nr:hypothetical protein [Sphaerochaetaceae bacterium]
MSKRNINIKIPMHLVSEANIQEHWTKKHRRKKKLQLLLLAYWPKNNIELPCTVSLTRIAPRTLDSDNLQFSFKYVRDFIADQLIPGKSAGRADDDDRIFWEYDQKKGKPKEYAIDITIESKLKVQLKSIEGQLKQEKG